VSDTAPKAMEADRLLRPGLPEPRHAAAAPPQGSRPLARRRRARLHAAVNPAHRRRPPRACRVVRRRLANLPV